MSSDRDALRLTEAAFLKESFERLMRLEAYCRSAHEDLYGTKPNPFHLGNLTLAARRAAGLDEAPGCKHLNLRLVGTNNAGTPFDCLDCGASELPWTALNALLAELHNACEGIDMLHAKLNELLERLDK